MLAEVYNPYPVLSRSRFFRFGACLLFTGLLTTCVYAQARAGAVQALPQFAGIVEKQGAIVVNISASQSQKTVGPPILELDRQRLPDWFKRFAPRHPDIEPEGREGEASGSGFIVSQDGYVLTNAHVVRDADDILVRLSDKREFPARLVGLDKRTDIALLKIEATNLPKAVLGDVTRLRVGDWVLAIGSPFGFDSSVTAGIVSAKGRSLPDETLVPFIQTDVAINPGNSGGPLFNLQGEVVGINSQIYSRSGGFMGISFAIPIDVAMDVQNQLRVSGQVLRGRIGVQIQDVTKEMADSFVLGKAEGAIVSDVDQGGPAAKAGVAIGDVILRFDGKSVGSSIDLPRIVSATRPGSKVRMDVWRARSSKTLQITVAAFPSEELKLSHAPRPAISSSNRLGLVAHDLTPEQLRSMGLKGGAAIREASGVAARAELRPGDVITELIAAGKTTAVRSGAHFDQLSRALESGAAVTLLVRRGDSQSFVGLKIPSIK